jgi:hypothetical protein
VESKLLDVARLHIHHSCPCPSQSPSSINHTALRRSVMAEPVGLALGAVALASLFSTCVELMDYFELSRTFEYDYDKACLKLSLLKFRLDTWGGETLPSPPVSPAALHTPKSYRARERCYWPPREKLLVQSSLQGIARIFGSADVLKSKYDLLPRKSLGANAATTRWGEQAAHLSRVFRRRACSSTRRVALIKRSTTWAIRDKNKFDCLIIDLEFFITNLEAVSTRLRIVTLSPPIDMSDQTNIKAANQAVLRTAPHSSSAAMCQDTNPQKHATKACGSVSYSHSEGGCEWSVDTAEGHAKVHQGSVDGEKLNPAPAGQVVSFRVRVAKDHAIVLGGAISSDALAKLFKS